MKGESKAGQHQKGREIQNQQKKLHVQGKGESLFSQGWILWENLWIKREKKVIFMQDSDTRMDHGI